MPLVASRANASAKAFGFSAALAGEELGGMVLMTPSSIASTGTGNSSSIGANGSVTFSSCATLSLNGVFTSEYDNYMIVFQGTESQAGSWEIWSRMRSSGTDATGSNYVSQELLARSTTLNRSRATDTYAKVAAFSDTLRNGVALNIYGPFLAQPTALRADGVFSEGSASLSVYAATHSLSTSYDGITIYPGAYAFTGTLSVYGLGG